MRKPAKIDWKAAFPVSIKDAITTTGMLFVGVVLSLLFGLYGMAENCAPMVFVLVTFLISRMTNGYLWGLFASVFSVLLVNYAFTWPYFSLGIDNPAYVVTFITMFVVSTLTCTLTTYAKAAESLRIANEKERTRANLLRAVSHDIRTPLTVISGTVSTVLEQQETLTDERKQALLRDAAEESRWLIRMVENLLTITRIDGEGGRLRKQPEAVEEVLAGAASKFRTRFPEAAVSVSAPEELLMAPMDATLTEQVLLNLMENAVRHGAATEIKLVADRSAQNARITVQDNGSGIEEAKLKSLFEGMKGRMELTESDNRHNMGLGLSVCRTIIEAQDGSITAENTAPQGARFTILLPMEAQEDFA